MTDPQKIAAEKQKLREYFLVVRREISPEKKQQAEEVALEKISALPKFQAAQKIGLYAALPDELAVDGLLPICRERGKQVYLPRVSGKVLQWHEISDLADCEDGSFGLREPRTDLPQVAISELDFLIVPGLAFTPAGDRLGFGGGFYDRALKEFSGFSLGVAFERQRADFLPFCQHDKKVNFVLFSEG